MSRSHEEPDSPEPPEEPAFARFQDDDSERDVEAGRGKLFAATVWIFGIGGSIAFIFTAMPAFTPRSSGPGVDASAFEVVAAEDTLRDRPIALTISRSHGGESDAVAWLGRTRDRLEELNTRLVDPEGAEGIGAINAAAGEPVSIDRDVRQVLEMMQEVAALAGEPARYVATLPASHQEPNEPAEAAAEASEGDGAVEAAAAPPEEAEAAAPGAAATSGPPFRFDRQNAHLSNPNTRLEPAEIGEGRAMDLVVAWLQDEGLRTFSLQWGDVTFYAGDFSGYPWVVELQNLQGGGSLGLGVRGRFVAALPGDDQLEQVILIGGRADRLLGAGGVMAETGSAEGALALAQRTVGTEALAVPRSGQGAMSPGFREFLLAP